MTRDYYSVLRRATSALGPSTEEARRAVYDRARVAIMDAGLPPEQTNAERAALEAAIERIEAETEQAEQARSAATRGAGRAPIAAAASDGHRPTNAAAPRWMMFALGAVVLLIIGAGGAAYWGMSGRHSRTATVTKAAPVSTTVPTVAGAPSGAPDTSYIFKRQLVYYRSIHPVGTMVIVKSQRFLYLVRPELVALRYTVGVGRECANAVGLLAISAKEEGEPKLAAASSSDSRPGTHWISLGDTGHRIFGTSPPIVSGADGCFQLANAALRVDDLDRPARPSVPVRGPGPDFPHRIEHRRRRYDLLAHFDAQPVVD